MDSQDLSPQLLNFIVDRAQIGVFVLNARSEIQLWNQFMATNSGKSRSDVLGRNLFECFPELPEKWFSKKISSVFMLKNFAFISWQQRRHLFPFRHNRPVSSGLEFMCQDVTLMPIKNGQGAVEQVCVIVFDATDTAIYQALHQAAMQSLEAMSRVDGLTQLFNRSHWQSRLDEEFSRAKRYGHPLSLIMFDLDHFKSINDTQGHQGGDAVLIHVAAVAKAQVRDCDVLGRYGGEEFALIATNTDEAGTRVVAERIRAAVANSAAKFGSKMIPVSTSVGLASLTDAMTCSDQLVSDADLALYKAKETGRNRVVSAADL